MKNRIIRLTLLAVIASSVGASAAPQAAPPEKIGPDLFAAISGLQQGQMTTVIVKLKARADLSSISGQGKSNRLRGIITALQATANASQTAIDRLLQIRSSEGKVGRAIPFWVFNGFSVTATADVILELAERDDVDTISPDAIDVVPAAPAGSPAEVNLQVVNAPILWGSGFTGQGIVVANLDTGVDVNHADLVSRWRGGSNSWYDPYGQHPTTPTDLDGHGTATMSVIVGGDAGGTSIGVAPGAKWIAVKIFNDSGSATATAIHQGFQWLLNPDGNINTTDAPDVVNNSWTYGSPGCNLEFEQDLYTLRMAGILPVFAAGNYGPGGSTSVSPANNPEAFAVGAIDNSSVLYAYSSRGPSACGESQTIYPELVATGVNIKSAGLFGSYQWLTGTSLAAPHVSGSLALLLSAYPALTGEQQLAALVTTAANLGVAGADNDYGYGRLDVASAYAYVQSYGGNPPAPPPPPPPAASLTLACASGTGQVSMAYSSALVASGGVTPYTFAITAGGLPPGLTLNAATGAITGTPATAGTYGYTAKVTDSTAGTPKTATSSCSITVAAVPSLHIGDLDRSSVATKTGWTASVTITAHAAGHTALSGVAVTAKWSGGISGTASCTTGAAGTCTITSGNIAKKSTSVTFTVTGAVRSAYVYQATNNHDPDGDSNGTAITVARP